MTMRKKVTLWSLVVVGLIGLLVFIFGPVLFASIAYPLPGEFREPIAKRAQQYGLSPNSLAALTFVESGFNLRAHSSAGAIGPTQFLPSTAVGVARNLGVSPFSPTDLTKNIDLAEWFAAYYVSQGIKNYGSEHLAYIAYNGGGAAANATKRGFGFSGPEGYANKIERIKKAYDAIYGEWWKDPITSSNNSLEFTVQPKYDLNVATTVPLTDFWRGLLSPNTEGPATTPDSPSSGGDLNNLWKSLLPGG